MNLRTPGMAGVKNWKKSFLIEKHFSAQMTNFWQKLVSIFTSLKIKINLKPKFI
jgi:hypothetical protein